MAASYGMTKRRTHSSIDRLPAGLREAITAMIVDGEWPEDFPQPADYKGRPRYEDVVTYCQLNGRTVSSSAVGRWAKGLLSLELLRTRAELVRGVMGDLTAEKATETQKAAAEMITARVLELVCSDELTSRQAKEVASAVRDCTAVSMKADQYIRDQVAAKAKEADKAITKLVKKKKIDPDVIRQIREQVYGIVQ